jgi:hypothetical protein
MKKNILIITKRIWRKSLIAIEQQALLGLNEDHQTTTKTT